MTRRHLSATTAQPSTTQTTDFAGPTTAAPETVESESTAPEQTEFGSGPCYTDDDGAMSTDAGDHVIPDAADEPVFGRGDSA